MVDCSTSRSASGAIVLLPKGRIELAAAADLSRQLHALIEDGDVRLVVDFSYADSVDSSGLGGLVSALKAAQAAGGDLRIVAPSGQILAIMGLSNVDRVLKVYESADAAFDD